jgi:hypothetical protein
MLTDMKSHELVLHNGVRDHPTVRLEELFLRVSSSDEPIQALTGSRKVQAKTIICTE